MDEQARQQEANFRYGLIASLVSRKLDPGEQMALMREIVSHEYETSSGQRRRISLRTLERYLKAYREGGWEALLPSVRADKLTTREIPEDVLAKAIALKQEQPGRSVRQIIAILELAAFVAPGTLKESTLSKQLRRRGVTRKALLNTGWSHFRRFEATHRNSMWQGDVQHTLYLPHPDKPGKKVMAYLVIFIDDYSRFVVHGQFYFEERVARLEDCLKKAILKNGVPEMIYVDNGAIYSSHHFERICGRLGAELKHTRPGRPMGRGKQEKFFRFVDQSFVPRFKQRPVDRYQKDDHPIRMLPPHELIEVFLLEESRKVDKTGCISLLGTIFEVQTELAGSKIQARFDPHDLSVIQVWKDGQRYEDAKPMKPRDPKTRPKQDEPKAVMQPPKTGLNYVELLVEEQKRQTREAQGAALSRAMKEVNRS
ncbi:DDE-type integrase/transposase/recombinase [Cohnella massiliensis]|uniref:DDE-type integrase/transposase/recombinase n=1 Tax=Cohnella massiliensis TaxID=1816691 RepID=UPI0009BAFAE6|nr:DDE-type integrase/transposase/recombinase [Cohnella massiliensis]